MSNDRPQSRAKIDGLDAARVLAHALQTTDAHPRWEALEPDVLASMLPAYEVIELIGRGAMGAVYRARQKSLDRMVAIKVLPLETSLDEGFAIRFQNEARLLARLKHPNIVAIYDTGTTSEGHLFLVMEMVEGTDLSLLIPDRSHTPAQSLDIIIQICAALKFAHQQGVVHRDIKPSNILIGSDQMVKVADFGLAKLQTNDASLSSPTLTGAIMGTPDYMAPEQRNGGTTDQRTDLYSLGVLIYEILTGHLPRGAWDPPSKTAGVDSRLDAVVTKAMQHEPGKRYPSIEALSADILPIRKDAEMPRWKRLLKTDVGCLGLPFQVLGWLIPLIAIIELVHVLPWPWTSEPAHARPLSSLELPAPGQRGLWQWQDQDGHRVLTASPGPPEQSSVITLPLEGHGRAYTATFDVRLNREGSNGGIIFPAGHSQTGLVINLQKVTGLGFVNGRPWNNNDTATTVPIQPSVWHGVSISVQPGGNVVTVRVSLNGSQIIEWNGLQSELTLYRDERQGWALASDDSFGFATYSGEVSYRNLRVQWLR